jgi:hypothetical protein
MELFGRNEALKARLELWSLKKALSIIFQRMIAHVPSMAAHAGMIVHTLRSQHCVAFHADFINF